ncbi:MAG TPA: hypothetical protein DDZ11_13525 [Lentisphaeria bacterium]|nr:hypothetical protein [Lentisphaeria bacterium]
MKSDMYHLGWAVAEALYRKLKLEKEKNNDTQSENRTEAPDRRFRLRGGDGIHRGAVADHDTAGTED